MLQDLLAYLDTPEGQAFYQRFIAAFDKPKLPAPLALSEREENALDFIRKQLKKAHSPSVREVASAVGLRSSRLGFQIVRSIKIKKLLL
jgi:hypothetical protein